MTTTKVSEIKFQVKFEDGEKRMLTPKEIADLKDKRRWVVKNANGVTVMRKSFKGA